MLFHCCLLFCSSISASRLAGIIGALFIPVPIGTILCGGGFLVPPRGPASPRRVRNRTASQRPFLVKLGSHSTAATNQRSRGVPSVLPTARQSMNSYSESACPRRRYSLHLINFSGAHGHTTAGPPQSLRGSRQRGRISVSFYLIQKRMSYTRHPLFS